MFQPNVCILAKLTNRGHDRPVTATPNIGGTMKLCPVCGANPCYAICPEADPFHGDQQAEDAAFYPEDLALVQARQEAECEAANEAASDDAW